MPRALVEQHQWDQDHTPAVWAGDRPRSAARTVVSVAAQLSPLPPPASTPNRAGPSKWPRLPVCSGHGFTGMAVPGDSGETTLVMTT